MFVQILNTILMMNMMIRQNRRKILTYVFVGKLNGKRISEEEYKDPKNKEFRGLYYKHINKTNEALKFHELHKG